MFKKRFSGGKNKYFKKRFKRGVKKIKHLNYVSRGGYSL